MRSSLYLKASVAVKCTGFDRHVFNAASTVVAIFALISQNCIISCKEFLKQIAYNHFRFTLGGGCPRTTSECTTDQLRSKDHTHQVVTYL